MCSVIIVRFSGPIYIRILSDTAINLYTRSTAVSVVKLLIAIFILRVSDVNGWAYRFVVNPDILKLGMERNKTYSHPRFIQLTILFHSVGRFSEC